MLAHDCPRCYAVGPKAYPDEAAAWMNMFRCDVCSWVWDSDLPLED